MTRVAWVKDSEHSDWRHVAVVYARGKSTVWLDGKRVAEGASWDIPLSGEDIKALSLGVSPLHIRPDHLQEWARGG